MPQSTSHSRLYIGLFVIMILIILSLVVSYQIAGLSGIGLLLALAAVLFIPFWFINQLWRIPLLRKLQTISPALSFIIKCLVMIIIVFVIFGLVFMVAIY